MQPILAAAVAPWEPMIWLALGMIGALGLLAVFSPRRFSLLALRGGQRVNSRRLAAADKGLDIDSYVLPFSRSLGLTLLAIVVLIGYVASHF